jgi:hypothetical protein
MYAGGNHSGVRPGDSGGPLVWYDPERQKYILYGVVSFIGAKQANALPSVFHFVPSSLDWIHNTINVGVLDTILSPLATNEISNTRCAIK